MSNQEMPSLPPEAQRELLRALDEVRAEIASGQAINLVLIRYDANNQPLPTLVGEAARLHFALTLAAGIIVQGGLDALQLHFHQAKPARTYFPSHETGAA